MRLEQVPFKAGKQSHKLVLFAAAKWKSSFDARGRIRDPAARPLQLRLR